MLNKYSLNIVGRTAKTRDKRVGVVVKVDARYVYVQFPDSDAPDTYALEVLAPKNWGVPLMTLDPPLDSGDSAMVRNRVERNRSEDWPKVSEPPSPRKAIDRVDRYEVIEGEVDGETCYWVEEVEGTRNRYRSSYFDHAHQALDQATYMADSERQKY
jgi:hypothetical protein